MFLKLCLAFIMVCLSACTPSPHLNNEVRPLPSGLGDGGVSAFYAYQGKLPAPGQLLKHEPLDPHQHVPGAQHNLRLLYTSLDGLNDEDTLAVSGGLFIPPGTPPEGGWPLLLWSHGTVGIADVCAPSWTGYVPFHQKHLQKWLEQGFAIAASDYQGLGTKGLHPYLATRPAAYSNLDLLRALRRADFPLSDRIILAGQSQGAGAAIATAAYAAEYAPDLDLRGVIVTGIPYFTPQTLQAIEVARPVHGPDPGLSYSFFALSLVQLIDPGFEPEAYISPDALTLAQSVDTLCDHQLKQAIVEAGLNHHNSFIIRPDDPLQKAFNYMQFPDLDLDTVPVFAGMGADDLDTPVAMQQAFVKDACQAGTQVISRLYEAHDHLSVLNKSLEDSLPFATRALTSEPFEHACTEHTHLSD